MIIKDFFIDKDLEFNILNDIIKFLINNNINYLYIKESKELHFDNYILKIKYKKNNLNEIYNIFFNILNNMCNNYNYYLDNYDNFIDNKYKKNNFKSIKNVNNLKINTKPKIKTLKKQMNPTKRIYK